VYLLTIVDKQIQRPEILSAFRFHIGPWAAQQVDIRSLCYWTHPFYTLQVDFVEVCKKNEGFKKEL